MWYRLQFWFNSNQNFYVYQHGDFVIKDLQNEKRDHYHLLRPPFPKSRVSKREADSTDRYTRFNKKLTKRKYACHKGSELGAHVCGELCRVSCSRHSREIFVTSEKFTFIYICNTSRPSQGVGRGVEVSKFWILHKMSNMNTWTSYNEMGEESNLYYSKCEKFCTIERTTSIFEKFLLTFSKLRRIPWTRVWGM